MRWAQVIDGKVQTRILWDGRGDPPLSNLVPDGEAVGLPDAANQQPVPGAVPGPRMVALLMRLGHWQPVADMIDQVIPEPQRTLARISLSGDWSRTGPMIVAAQAWLGWGDELVDEWFRMAPREPIE